MRKSSETLVKSFNVGMGEIAVTSSPNILFSLGLGSCIGLILFDESEKIAAMAHIMLPRNPKQPKRPNVDKLGKFADSAVSTLIEQLETAGTKKRFLKAKIAGGASMFGFSSPTLVDIGRQNAEVVREMLAIHSIPVIAEDTGGSKGRSIKFFTGDCTLEVKSIGQGTARY